MVFLFILFFCFFCPQTQALRIYIACYFTAAREATQRDVDLSYKRLSQELDSSKIV